MGGRTSGLERLQSLETLLAETYDWLAGVFADDGEAAALFERMSREERSHAKLVGHEIRLLSSDEAARVVDIVDEELDELFGQLRDLREAEGTPRLDEAVATALLVESSAYERSGGEVVRSTRPAINELIRKLARANEEHEARLQAFAEDRGFLVWVEDGD